MTASRRLLTAIAALAGFGLLSGAWQALGGPWPETLGLLPWGLALVMGVTALVDAALLARLPVIHVRRALPGRLRAGETATIELWLSHAGPRPLQVRVQDLLPAGMATPPPSQVRLIPPGQPALVRYPLLALQRGRWTLGRCVVRLASPLGLWHGRRPGATAQSIDVYPALLGQPARLTSGAHEPGWPLILVLDGGHPLAPPQARPEAFERLLAACLRLGQAALAQGDAVGLLALTAGPLVYLPPRTGPGQSRALFDTLYAAEAGTHPTAHQAGAEVLLQRQARRAWVIWLHDGADQDHEPLLSALAALRRYHQVLLVNLRDEAVDDLRQRPVENTEQALAYCGAMRRQADQARLRAHAIALGATWLEASSAHLGRQLVAHYLASKRAAGE